MSGDADWSTSALADGSVQSAQKGVNGWWEIGQGEYMTSFVLTGSNVRTGPPGDDDWIGYTWMILLVALMTIGYTSLVQLGAL